jgi:hypothetical protein
MRSLIEELMKVKLTEERTKVLNEPAIGLAHYPENLKVVFWYSILSNTLEYSETATTHQDYRVFKGPFADARGWIRGRVFKYEGKYYIVVYLEDWLDSQVLNRSLADIYNQIQSRFKHIISDIVDENGYALTENKKRGN